METNIKENKVQSCFTLSNKAKAALLSLLAAELSGPCPVIRSQSAWIENAILEAYSQLILRNKK